jgi:hypothetical protein
MLVLGDDMLLVVYNVIRAREIDWKTELQNLGFNVKIKFPHAYTAQFCSGRFYFTNNGLVLGPKIGRILAKIGYSLSNPHKSDEHIKGVVLGQAKAFCMLPVLREYYDKTMSLVPKKSQSLVDRFKINVREDHELSIAGKTQLNIIYGAYYSVLNQLAEDINKCERLTNVVVNPFFREIVLLDR